MIPRVPHRTLGTSKASPWRTKIKGPLLPIAEPDDMKSERATMAMAGSGHSPLSLHREAMIPR
eukprot:4675875-Heterocapsa_arctica.AAC.1